MKKETQVTELILCDCRSYEHQMIVSYDTDDEDKQVFLSIHLVNRGFIRRIISGFKYIFGYKSRFGQFDEIVLNPNDADKLQAVVDFLRTQKRD